MTDNTLEKLVEDRVKKCFSRRLDVICDYVSEEIYASIDDNGWLEEKELRGLKISLPEFLSLKTSTKQVAEVMRSNKFVSATMEKLSKMLTTELADTLSYAINDNISGVKSNLEYEKRLAEENSERNALLLSAKKKLASARLSKKEKTVLGIG